MVDVGLQKRQPSSGRRLGALGCSVLPDASSMRKAITTTMVFFITPRHRAFSLYSRFHGTFALHSGSMCPAQIAMPTQRFTSVHCAQRISRLVAQLRRAELPVATVMSFAPAFHFGRLSASLIFAGHRLNSFLHWFLSRSVMLETLIVHRAHSLGTHRLLASFHTADHGIAPTHFFVS